MKGQLDQAKANLDQQDQKLAEFQKQYMGTLPEQQQPNMEMLNTLNTQLDATTQALTRLENDKTMVESMLAQESRQTPAAPGMRSTPQADNRLSYRGCKTRKRTWKRATRRITRMWLRYSGRSAI